MIYMEGRHQHAAMTRYNGMAVWARHSNPAWCRICAANTYNEHIGAKVCSDCPANSRAAPGSTSRLACTCLAGYIGPAGGPCEACAEGTYQPQEGTQSCLACAQNTISLPASLSCQCDAGWTGPDNGPCTTCHVNTSKGVAGSGACQTCPVNTKSQSTGGIRCQCLTGMLGIGNVLAHETTPIFKTPLVMNVPGISQTKSGPWRYRTDWVYQLPSAYNKVSVMARNYRQSVSVALSGFALPNFAISDEQRCGTATFVPAHYNPGDTLSVSENWNDISSELYLILELAARDFVDCTTCPAGYIISSDDGTPLAQRVRRRK